MPYVRSGDAEVYYEVSGVGEPLLLIAGLGSDIASWAPVGPILGRHFRLIALDNRGAGRTRHSGPIRPEDWVDDCIAVLDHAGVAKAHVLGHSLGGTIGIRLARQAPDRVNRLVLAAAPAENDSKSLALLEEMAALYESGIEPQAWFRLLFQWLFAPPFFDDPANVAEAGRLSAAYEHCQSPRDFRRQVEALRRLTACDPREILCDSMLLTGDLDIMIPPELSRRQFAGIPRLRMVGIPGAGHSLHWDRPQAFADEILRFLSTG